MHVLRRLGEAEAVTGPEPPPVGPSEEPEPVPVLIVECAKCRREQSEARRNARKGNGFDGPRFNVQATPSRCPHFDDVWAPGLGPGSDPLPAPGTPEERRQGPV